ncbi:hypothetical protein [Novosphingobium guangzhouense]|uniref:Uncharacterized protein n=1 Tax=Novosphingobium guangzhouense TaxID=1850347 RepID=A0A2K2G440_9SPHN|nr:hypothetical protein [Novosphingobium guangzhouense]PNU05810.1 hypothetical protein A8V01_14690 [Novosphingobium guangzhouense]
MAKHYVKQQRGVSDGTEIPAKKADGREVNAEKRVILASKVTGTAWASGDTVVLGKKPVGCKVTAVRLTTGTSLGTSTVSIGTAAAPAKYVNAATLTATNVPTVLGPLASTLDDDPGAEEELIATIGVAAIVAGTELTFEIEHCGI